MQSHTLVEALDHNRSRHRYVCFMDGQEQEKTVSYEALYQRALGLLHLLQQKGIHKGDHLILFLHDNRQMVDVFWACQLGGIIPVPLAVGISAQHRRKVFNVAKKLGSPFLYTNRKSLSRLEASDEDHAASAVYRQLAGKTLLSDDVVDVSTAGRVVDVAPDDISFIQFSSGSTGDPKGIVLKHRNLIANIEGIEKGAAFSHEDVSLSWMPLTHDMGLIGFHVNPVVCNYSHCIMRTDLFIRRPLYWMIAASEKKTNVLCSPNFGYKHFLNALERKGLDDVDLSHVRLIFNGAEPISVNLCRQFASRLARYGLSECSMFPVYGLAEASLAVSFPEIGAPLEIAQVERGSLSIGGSPVTPHSGDDRSISLVGVGRPVKNCKVRISDREGNALPENTVGHVHIGGTNVTEEIIGEDAAVFFEDGWVDTGDLGFVSGQGLFITGRHKEVIFVNGQNYYPHDIEEVLHAIPHLELGKVAVTGTATDKGGSDEVLVFVLHKGDLKAFIPVSARVAAMASEHFSMAVHQVIPVRKIPKTTSGKIQRTALAENYLAGNYDEVIGQLGALMNEGGENNCEGYGDEIVGSITRVCREALPDKSFSVHDNLLELGTSSLALVEIHAGLDELYPDTVEVTDLVEYPTIAKLADFIRQRQG